MNCKTAANAKEPYRQQRSVHRSFKSPLLTKNNIQPDFNLTSSPSEPSGLDSKQYNNGNQYLNLKTVDELQKELDDLKEELKETEQGIQELKDKYVLLDNGLQELELAEHIKKLHEYNEIKDMAQMVLGHLATLQGVTTRDLYAKYGLELDD